MQNELLVVYATQLLEKEHSGCRALLRDDKVYCYLGIFFYLVFSHIKAFLIRCALVYFKVEDLSRIYRLYHKITKGLDPVAAVFKQVSCFLLMIDI